MPRPLPDKTLNRILDIVESAAPATLSAEQIARALQPPVPPRSLRYYLAALVKEGCIIRDRITRGSRYRAPDYSKITVKPMVEQPARPTPAVVAAPTPVPKSVPKRQPAMTPEMQATIEMAKRIGALAADIVALIVRCRMIKLAAHAYIRQSAQGLSPTEAQVFIGTAEFMLDDLSPDNLSNYGLTLAEFTAWKSGWR